MSNNGAAGQGGSAPPSLWLPPLLALCWGLNWPAVRVILTEWPPFTFRFVGLGLAGLLLLGLALLRGAALRPPRGTLWLVVAGGFFNVAGFNLATAFAQLHTTTSRAAVLTYTMPLMMALLAWWLLRERPGRRVWLALGLGAAGLALLAEPVAAALGAHGLGRTADGRLPLLGIAMPLLAALSWALGTVVAKRWGHPGDRLANTGWQMMVGCACAAVGIGLSGERWPVAVSPLGLAVLGYHVVVATAFAYLLWYRMLDGASASVSSLTTLMVPVVGVLGAMLLNGERPDAQDIAGFALVLAAAGAILLPAWRRRGAP
ncbi:MAG: DMT family transporter [Aquabacterium sp.]